MQQSTTYKILFILDSSFYNLRTESIFCNLKLGKHLKKGAIEVL